jgi:hypothetical protein
MSAALMLLSLLTFHSALSFPLKAEAQLEANEDQNEDDFYRHLDKADFKDKVGIDYDEWVEHVQAVDHGIDVDAMLDVEDDLAAGELWGGLGKAVKKHVVKPVKRHVVDKTVKAVKTVVNKGIDYFKKKAEAWAKGMLAKVLKSIQWKPHQYWAFMTRIPKDFTGTQIDTNDDYSAFHKHGDAATQRMLRNAFGSMPHQDKCDRKRSGWNEFHPTPFSEIAKMPNSPFKVEPFKSQYRNDPKGYFLEPCNAISNGFFLSVFNHPDLASRGNCGSVGEMEEIEEQSHSRALLNEDGADDLLDVSEEDVPAAESTNNELDAGENNKIQASTWDHWGGGRRRRSRRRRSHSHNPHRHHPHRHNPHRHNPHSHSPHRHRAPPPAKNDPFAMNCIDENHLLQVVTAAMPFGSWFMHGSGGAPLGGFLDVRGMDVQFYFMYRNVLKAYVPNANARKLLTLTHACNKHFVPDVSDGIRWVDSNGERLCHLYWARQMKKMLTNSTLVADGENTAHATSMLKGLPDMGESIAAIIFVTVRAVFHKRFPFGQKIYETLTAKLVDALMAKHPKEVRDVQKAFAKNLKPDEVLGFENPHDGLVHVLNIFADFMDAMFFQEQGKFGPGTFVLTKKNRYFEGIPPTAGCTLMPHATWHRKATRVILGFIKMGKSLKSKLKNPNHMRLFYMKGLKPSGLYPSLLGGVKGLIQSLTQTFNMKTLAGWDFSKKPDILNPRGFVNYLKKKFGNGWPKKGAFVGDKWPKCTCKRAKVTDKCPGTSGTNPPIRAGQIFLKRRVQSPITTRPAAAQKPHACQLAVCKPVCKQAAGSETLNNIPKPSVVIPKSGAYAVCAPDPKCLAANAGCISKVKQAQKHLDGALANVLKRFTK